MFEYEHVCLKYKIVHGDADAHCSQCVFISFPQTPRSQDLSRDSNTGLVQISSGKGHCFLSLSLSHVLLPLPPFSFSLTSLDISFLSVFFLGGCSLAVCGRCSKPRSGSWSHTHGDDETAGLHLHLMDLTVTLYFGGHSAGCLLSTDHSCCGSLHSVHLREHNS